ncbi:MAG: hemerythrin domain-containing protein [Elusimicrobia bacterium]|nr:hemerythrin domain-containing protein [Elusimicrobiota bacterium]
MSVFQSLAEEHALMRELGRRLRRSLDARDEERAPRETRNILLVLLHALAGHERFEDKVFGEPLESSPGAVSAAAALARQHAAIARLRAETEALIQEGAGVDLRLLRPLAERLVAMLDAHFESEERELWPQLNSVVSRAARSRADREAAERLAELRKELASYWTAVDEYLSSDS